MMRATSSKQYEKIIKGHMLAKGLIEPGETSFDVLIKTLADVLHDRDVARKLYEKEGEQILVEYTSNRGETNRVRNPLLDTISNLNTQALAHWKELGMTPAQFKKNEEPPKVSPIDSFNFMLDGLEAEKPKAKK